jgi:hypothetical protein
MFEQSKTIPQLHDFYGCTIEQLNCLGISWSEKTKHTLTCSQQTTRQTCNKKKASRSFENATSSDIWEPQ